MHKVTAKPPVLTPYDAAATTGARDSMFKAISSFNSVVADAEQVSASAWGRSVSPVEASVLLGRAKAAIIDLDAGGRSNKALSGFATRGITDIYATLSKIIPQGSRTAESGWIAMAPSLRETISDAFLPDRPSEKALGPRERFGLKSDSSAQNRKNLSAYRALGALVAKLTQS